MERRTKETTGEATTSLNEEEMYAFESIKAELIEGIYTSNMIEIETKHSVGKKLLEIPGADKLLNKEAKYYIAFARRYPDIEKIHELDMGKVISWYKIKNELKKLQPTKDN